MKKRTIVILTAGIFSLLNAGAVYAQKGSWYIGGQGGYTSRTEENTNIRDIETTQWAVAPEIGTFLQDHLQLGFAVNLGGGKTEDLLTETETTKFSPVLYLRRFFKVGDKFATFVGVVGNVTTGNVKIDTQKNDLSGWGANLSLGAAYALSDRWTAVGQYGLLGYTSSTIENDFNKNTVNNLGLNVNSLGPVFNVGLYWTFKP
jgi:hypothetical protein